MEHSDLRELLERLHDTYNRPAFIADDPICIPHRYTDRRIVLSDGQIR